MVFALQERRKPQQGRPMNILDTHLSVERELRELSVSKSKQPKR